MQHETSKHHDGEKEHVHHEASHGEHVTHHKKGFELTTPLAILLGAVLIAIGLLGHGFFSKGGGGELTYLDTFTGKSPLEEKHIEGKKNGDVYFVEYSDSECPYCIAFHKTVSEIRQKYAGKVTFIYRHYPLPFHPDAMPEAIQMNCAGKLAGDKAYFDFMTKMFDYKVENKATKINDAFTDAFLAQNKIDKTAFTACRQDPAMKAEVEASMQDGSQAGVTGTPTSYVLIKDGNEFKVVKRLEGASQPSFIAPILDKALKM
jgi:protein-disulfide isomerase